jgi:hypothetical protein
VRLALASIALALLGLASSRRVARALERRAPEVGVRAIWVAGLLALLPAWLVPFIALLGAVGSAGAPPRLAFLAASATAILGVIASDALLARAERAGATGASGHPWRLGALALLPGWLTALFLAARLPG